MRPMATTACPIRVFMQTGRQDLVNYAGYVEVAPNGHSGYSASETRGLFSTLAAEQQPVDYVTVTGLDDVWAAVKHFFAHEAQAQ